MKILLDTHAFLWFVMDSPKISKRAASLIESTENEVYLSVASVWEMAIKVSIGKLRIDERFEDFIMPA
jgi:PIN domain nuclease of toxin-antitoxin system